MTYSETQSIAASLSYAVPSLAVMFSNKAIYSSQFDFKHPRFLILLQFSFSALILRLLPTFVCSDEIDAVMYADIWFDETFAFQSIFVVAHISCWNRAWHVHQHLNQLANGAKFRRCCNKFTCLSCRHAIQRLQIRSNECFRLINQCNWCSLLLLSQNDWKGTFIHFNWRRFAVCAHIARLAARQCVGGDAGAAVGITGQCRACCNTGFAGDCDGVIAHNVHIRLVIDNQIAHGLCLCRLDVQC